MKTEFIYYHPALRKYENGRKMQLLGLLLMLLQISSSLCEMQKTIKVEKLPFPKYDSVTAAQYPLEVGDQKEVTLCLKFRLFSYNEGYGQLFWIARECPPNMTCVDNFSWTFMIGWKTGMEDDGKQAAQTHLNFSHDNETMYEQMLTRIGKAQWHANLLEDWVELFEWQSACYTWSVLKKKELLYVNGKFAFGYEWSKQFSKGWSDYPILLKLMGNWRGEVTDLNLYDSFFEEEQMVSWTMSCGIPAEGRIFSWEPEKFNLTNNDEMETVISEVASDDLCQSQSEDTDILEIFDNGIGKSPIQCEQYCERLKGRLTMVPTTEEAAFIILKRYNEHIRKRNLTDVGYFGTWLSGRADLEGTEFVETKEGYNVYPKDGKWVAKDPDTNEIIGTPFPVVPEAATYSKPTQLCFVAGHIPTARTLLSPEKIYPFGKALSKS